MKKTDYIADIDSLLEKCNLDTLKAIQLAIEAFIRRQQDERDYHPDDRED